MKQRFKYVNVLLALVFLGGCASKQEVTQIPEGSDPSEQIAQFEKELGSARDNRAAVLSPTYFQKAERDLADAKEIRSKQGKYTDIYAKIEDGRKNLEQAEKFRKISETALEPVIKAREEAVTARQEAEKSGARNLEGPFADADSYFQKLTSSVEDDNLRYAEQHRVDAIQKYRIAKSAAQKAKALDPSRQLINQAKDEGASKYAPKALKLAEENFDATEKFVDNNPQATEDIQKRADTTLFYSKRVANLTRESKWLADRDDEDRVLWVENSFASIGKAFGTPDHRDRSFQTQIAELQSSAERYHQMAANSENQAQGAATEAEELKSRMSKLRSEVNRTQANLILDRKFEEIRKQFSPDEAEVLRDGERLIIRVRSINFPVGKAQLAPENFALLAKVTKAIQEFDEARVTVEGHTDSSGSQALNARLSKERANVVREYLVANGAAESQDVTAVGMGFSRPLADNKSAAGKAINRRIDVVISPSMTVTADQQKGGNTTTEEKSEPATKPAE